MRAIVLRGVLPLLLLGACLRSPQRVTVQLLTRADGTSSRTSGRDVELFGRGVVPPAKYLELAILRTGGIDQGPAVERLRMRAREIGADGLLLQGWTTPEGRIVGTASGARDQLTAVAVRYLP